jgi:hypothetical protein
VGSTTGPPGFCVRYCEAFVAEIASKIGTRSWRDALWPTLPGLDFLGSIVGKSYTPHESAIPKLLIW